ncbi:prenyltransferase/squalene oxidase repeat-containing protein [Streptomyces sp. ICBB 8177]|uniref:prenyltransferase/squalene oxidase repeat-containing protein n=1 Tax=Streptomyces sp. ICBB 8177 TaxID=563922 RepID=UPI000D67E867|nr:prenyltransferase/squalene oxidase repeat-containing protein [Streptomyces sp. ICBB 8177]PWI42645.1 hypothetical protein CK485_10015 [Streptomyces sp. ICBB 8177]
MNGITGGLRRRAATVGAAAVVLLVTTGGFVPPALAAAQPSGTASPAPAVPTTAVPSVSASASASSSASAPAAVPPVTGPSSSAQSSAATAKSPNLTKGTDYLVASSRLIGGHYYDAYPGVDFADYGMTIDGAFALAATGRDDAALKKIVAFFQSQGKDGSSRSVNDWTGIGTAYAGGGSLGKEALLAEVVGADPRAFGGHDLIAALDKAVCAKASTGTDTSCAAPGNYTYATSVFSQALGIMAQIRAGDGASATAPVKYLESLQHSDGSWPSLIPATGDSDVDSTAMAVMALALVHGDAASAAVDRGVRWIAAQQEKDGGFPGASGDSTNSAALAVQGMTLRKSTYSGQIARALAFLAAQQNSDGGFNVASSGQRGSDVRASTQVVSGATGISFGTLERDLSGKPAPTSSASAAPTATATLSAGPTPSISTIGGAGTGASSTNVLANAVGDDTSDGGLGGVLAHTGTDARGEAELAALLLLVGAAAVAVGRHRFRRTPGQGAIAEGRHR